MTVFGKGFSFTGAQVPQVSLKPLSITTPRGRAGKSAVATPATQKTTGLRITGKCATCR